jgi:hypothetical protein
MFFHHGWKSNGKLSFQRSKTLHKTSFLIQTYSFAICGVPGSIHNWGTKKGMSNFLRTIEDNFEFLFILHYYSCNGLLYANI